MSNTESSTVYYNANLSTLHVRSDYDPSQPENYQRLWEDVVLMAREHARQTTPKLVKNEEQAVEYAILYERDVDGDHSCNEMWVGTMFHWRYNSAAANGKIVLQRRNKTLTIERSTIELRADDYYSSHIQTITTDHEDGLPVLTYHWDRIMQRQLRREMPYGLPTSPELMIESLIHLTYDHQRKVDRTGDELPMISAVTQFLFRKIHRLNGIVAYSAEEQPGSWRDSYYGSHAEVTEAIPAWYSIMGTLKNLFTPPETSLGEAAENPEAWCDRHLEYLAVLVRALGVQKTLVEKFHEQDIPGSRHWPPAGLNRVDAGYYKQLMLKLKASLA